MCMLCVVPPNVIPTRDKLENSALNNPDGFGFAIVIPQENRIHVERTMNPDSSINRFLEMRGKYPESYAMWHARLATHGSTTVDNCHPFNVGYDNRTVLAHNGILPIIQPQGDTRSDTRIFAEDLLPRMGGVAALDNEQVYNLVEEFTHGSKVCILTIDPEADKNCYLLHENKGKIDESGVWWSNDSCDLSYSRYAYSLASTYKAKELIYEDDGYILECFACKGVMDLYDQEDDLCPYCYSCQGCRTTKDLCLCYNPVKPIYSSHGGWYHGY